MPVIRTALSRIADSFAASQSVSLIGWQALSLVASLGLTALMARGLDVPDFGEYRYAITFLAFGMTVLQFGLPYSLARLLALESSSAAQRKLVGLSVIVGALATLLGVVATFCVVLLAGAAGVDLPLILLWVSPALCVTLGQAMIANACQGLGRISLLASQQILPYAILLPITAFQLYVLHRYSLIAALLGYAITFLIVIVFGFHQLGVSFSDPGSNWSILKRENVKTGLPIYVGAVFGVASAQFISMWVATFVSSYDYGHYALAVAVSATLAVLLSSVGTVIFRPSARMPRLPATLIVLTVALGTVLGIAYLVVVEWILTLVFGEKYEPAVWMAQWLGVASLLVGFGDVLQRFLGAHGRGRELGAASVATGVVGMVAAALLLPNLNIVGAIIASISAATTYLTLLMIVYLRYIRVVRRENRDSSGLSGQSDMARNDDHAT